MNAVKLSYIIPGVITAGTIASVNFINGLKMTYYNSLHTENAFDAVLDVANFAGISIVKGAAYGTLWPVTVADLVIKRRCGYKWGKECIFFGRDLKHVPTRSILPGMFIPGHDSMQPYYLACKVYQS